MRKLNLYTDLYIPKRLYDKLKTVYTERLTVIAAPDGFGKTETLREFIRRSRKKGFSCRWINDNISAGDCFSKYCRIVLGIEEHIPVTQSDYNRLCRAFEKTTTSKMQMVIFDSPAAEEMITKNIYVAKLFTKFAPASAVVLCTKLSYIHDREIAYYKIHSIREDDFRLTFAETAEYFSSCDIYNANTKKIHAFAGGEILRTRLCAILCKEGIEISSYRPERLVISAVIRRLSPTAQLAGICASACSELNIALVADLAEFSELSEYFGGTELSLPMLHRGIAEINEIVPLIRFNARTGQHQPHIELMRGFYHFFTELPENVRKAVHICCARELLRSGKTFRAFCQFVLAGDYGSAAAVDVSSEMLPFELIMQNKELLFKFAVECPLEFKPILPRLLRTLSLLMLTPYKNRIAYRFGEIISHLSASPDYSETERRELMSYTYSLQTYQDFYMIEKMGTDIKLAYDLFVGNKKSAPAFYSWSTYCPSVFSLVHRYTVPIKTEAEQFRRYHRMYTEMMDNGEYIDDLYIAEAKYTIGDFAGAFKLARIVVSKCNEAQFVSSKLIALIICARCSLFLGDYGQFKHSTAAVADIMRLDPSAEIRNMAALCLALICCMKTGGNEDIWPICASPEPEVLLNRYAAPYYFFVRSFAMLNHKDCKSLLAKKDYFLQAAKDVRNEVVYVMLQLCALTAHYLMSEYDEAATIAEEVLETLYRSGITIHATEFCVHFPQMFEFAKERLSPKYAEYLDRVLAEAVDIRRNVEFTRTKELTELSIEAAEGGAEIEKAVNALPKSPLLSRLSHIALKYALLASRGLSNEEIAQICGASVDSVKSSLKRSFAKLGIHSRGQLKHIFKHI